MGDSSLCWNRNAEPHDKRHGAFTSFFPYIPGMAFRENEGIFRYNVLSIGFTNNIRRRVYEHKRKLIYGFTSKYNCTILVWYEKFTDVNLAITREKQLKTWQRSWKNNLIEKHNPNWLDLAKYWFVKDNA